MSVRSRLVARGRPLSLRAVTLAATVALAVGVIAPAVPAAAAGPSGASVRTLTPRGATTFHATPAGTDHAPQAKTTEIPSGPGGDTAAGAFRGSIVNRSQSKHGGGGASAPSGQRAKSNPEFLLGFSGLDHFDQRFANNGNQFSLEPPDQGLCAGNGYVLETVNDVLQVYDASGHGFGVMDQNSFYGYPAQFDRGTGLSGPFITDPSCLYDQGTQRWYHVVLTLDQDPVSGAFLGTNHIDIAVSDSPSPLGTWHRYSMPVQDNGTAGTPDHGCSYGFCLGDYPHIGADKSGFYITTNEYSFFGPEFKSANIYAFSKSALAAGGPVGVVQFQTLGAAAGNPGFTVWPAVAPDANGKGNTEYFLSSDATSEANNASGTSSRIFLWQLSGTNSLGSAAPSLTLTNSVVPVAPYGIPPQADQKSGPNPLGALGYGAGVNVLDANDSRMQQVMYANGKLWAALDTAVTVGGVNKAGIEWFILNPNSGKVDSQGYLALANNNLTYPAVGVTKSGRGVIAFTLVGADYYPSAAYASLDAKVGAGEIKVAAAGLGPQDGFSEYQPYFADGSPRPRWGDYGAAVVDGNNIWIASEYIGQTCTNDQFAADFTCGGTRSFYANWGTFISKLGL